MGALLQRLLLRVLPPESIPSDGSAERQHVTAALGCCSTIHIDEHVDETHVDETHVDENAHHDKEDIAEDDSSDLG